MKLIWKTDCEIQVPILNGSELPIPISARAIFAGHERNENPCRGRPGFGCVWLRLKTCIASLPWFSEGGCLPANRKRAKSSRLKELKRVIAVRAGIGLDSLHSLFHCVFPYPDDLLAFFLSHHTGCFHFFPNVG